METIAELVKRMAEAEASYGSGFEDTDEWRAAYDELLERFGFDAKWGSDVGRKLHNKRWAVSS